MGDILTPSIKSLLINGCLVILAFTLLYSIILMIGGTHIFEKAKKNKISAYFPILNLFVVLEMVDMSSFWGILFFIPIFNLVALSIMSYKLGTVFNTSFKFKIGLVVFSLCFYPLLAFSDYKYKISDEEYFKALDNAKDESINLLTPEDIKEENNVVEEPKEKIDSVFKGEWELKEKVGPYKAQKIENSDNEKLESEEVENPFKPIEIVKAPEQIKVEEKVEETHNKFIDETKKEKTEFLDL